MSEFHHVFCRSSKFLPFESLQDLVLDAWYGDDDLTVSAASFGPDGQWSQVNVFLNEDTAPPLSLMRDTDSSMIGTLVDEALEEYGRNISSELASALKASRQVTGVELRREQLDDDWWEMLDIVQANLAQQLDGLLLVPSEGLFDGTLQRVASFDGSVS